MSVILSALTFYLILFPLVSLNSDLISFYININNSPPEILKPVLQNNPETISVAPQIHHYKYKTIRA